MKKTIIALVCGLLAFSANANTTTPDCVVKKPSTTQNSDAQKPKISAEEAVCAFAETILYKLRNKDANTSASDAIKEDLDDIISYPVIVKNVMGDYYKEANEKQLRTFIIIFRKSLIDTFAQGFDIFTDYKVTLSDVQDANGSLTSTQVYLDVTSPEGEVFKITQTMYYSPDKQKWRMLNAVLNGINLGIIFRNQYKQLVGEANGDIDLTSKLWLKQMQAEYEKQLEAFNSED